jgi:hypothetical protein
VEIDDKGGEVSQLLEVIKRRWTLKNRRGSTKMRKHTSRGSKLMNLIIAFVMCIFMSLLAFAQVLN